MRDKEYVLLRKYGSYFGGQMKIHPSAVQYIKIFLGGKKNLHIKFLISHQCIYAFYRPEMRLHP